MFKSRVEKRITLPIILAVTLPMLAVTLFAMQMIRAETTNSAQSELERMAKDYGLTLLDRLQRRAANAGISLNNKRPSLKLENGVFSISDGDSKRKVTIPLSTLAHDQGEVAAVYRCISTQGQPCQGLRGDILHAHWVLRLVSQFDTDQEILVVTSLTREQALEGIGLITKLFPLVVALIACLVGYLIVVYLRASFKPLAKLKSAVKEIETGSFDRRLDIRTADEFESLGLAINAMSQQIGSEISFRRDTSDLDAAILANAPLQEVLQEICRYCIVHCGATKAVAVIPDTEISWQYFGTDHVSELSASAARDKMGSAPLIPGFDDHHEIMRDEQSWGWLSVATDENTDQHRLQTLASRASVAVTNEYRVTKLYRQAHYDNLTGLYNRVAFAHELERIVSLSRRQSSLGALVFFDLDQFKTINDTEGHSVGDELLCKVAHRLKKYFRETDIVARFGGDEFAVALNDVGSRQDLLQLLKRLTETFLEPIRIGQFEHTVSCSIGVCLIPTDGDDGETLLKNADVAMYRAKATQGTSFVFFNTAQQQETERRMLVERKLRTVIQNNQLDVFLQPKLQLSNGTIHTQEALVRWHDDELGFVSPLEFVDIAERCGMISDLTERVIERVATYLDQDPRISRVAINISPVQLAAANFCQRFLARLEHHGIDTNRVEVEVTESVFMSDLQNAKDKLCRLKDEGIKIALDDFGTGFSSLNLLTQLPINTLKLDKSFIDRIPHEENATLVLSKIVEMARGLQMDVVAEGVEHEEQLHALDSMGVTQIQGYLIAKPQPFENIQELLSAWEPMSRLAGGNRV